jgi:hypothetical protein
MEKLLKALETATGLHVEIKHVIVLSWSLISVIERLLNEQGSLWFRLLSLVGSLALGCLAGLIALEVGVTPWLCGGLAYLGGQLGNILMSGLRKLAQGFAERPMSFLREALALGREILELMKFWKTKGNGTQP